MGVYIVGSDEDSDVKVGFTSKTKPEGRMRDFQTGFRGAKVVLVAWASECTREHEKQLHGLLKACGAHKSREWFYGDHVATKAVVSHMKRNNFHLAVKALETRLREQRRVEQPWAHVATINGLKLSLHNCSKSCTSCKRDLPLISAHWGQLWLTDNKGGLRDQPQCVECRFSLSHFKDSKTTDMFKDVG